MAWVEQCGNRTWRVRYRRDDGTIGAINGFTTKTAATDHANSLESDQREGRFIDPAAGKITLRRLVAGLAAGASTSPSAPRTSTAACCAATSCPAGASTAWSTSPGSKPPPGPKSCATTATRRPRSAAMMKLLSLLLADAAEERLIPANPIRARRRGRRRAERRTERVWATPAEVLAVADNAARLPGGGPDAAILIVTAAWTGARWGELAGLQRTQHPPRPRHRRAAGRRDRPATWARCIESSRGLELGPPKTAESARTITLPPFLVELLRAHLATHDHRFVFATPDRQLHRRSNFGRRALRPAADGTPAPRPQRWWLLAPVKPGLTFHGLRHGHKTWMIADGVPEVAQARRLGPHPRRPDPRDLLPRRRRSRTPACSPGCRTAGTKPSPTAPTNPRGGNRDRATRSRPTTDAAWAARVHRPHREGRSPS